MLLAALLLYPLLSSVAWVWLYVSTRRAVTLAERRWRASYRLLASEASAIEGRCSDMHRAACGACKGYHAVSLGGIVRVRQQIAHDQRRGPWASM